MKTTTTTFKLINKWYILECFFKFRIIFIIHIHHFWKYKYHLVFVQNSLFDKWNIWNKQCIYIYRNRSLQPILLLFVFIKVCLHCCYLSTTKSKIKTILIPYDWVFCLFNLLLLTWGMAHISRKFKKNHSTSLDFNYVKPCFDLLQFSFNFITLWQKDFLI